MNSVIDDESVVAEHASSGSVIRRKKDSTYACWWAIMQGWKVGAMITVHVTSDDSMMFQLPNTSLAGLQAHSIGVPWLPILSKGNEEEEINDLENGIREQVILD